MARLARRLALIAGFWLAQAAGVQAASPFADWSAVVVAGDWHAHDGAPTETFDNARRDVSAALQRAGFRAENLRQFSVRPERYRDTRPARTDLEGIYGAMADLSPQTPGGCLVYLTSHGAPQGVLMDQRILAPAILAGMVDGTCGEKPTVVVISACFSGVFVPYLAKPNRMVLTAARRDRSSFGCGQDDKYPYFDDCFLRAMPTALDFATLGAGVKACVTARETQERVSPPSEPQMFVGGALRPILPLLSFQAAARD